MCRFKMRVHAEKLPMIEPFDHLNFHVICDRYTRLATIFD